MTDSMIERMALAMGATLIPGSRTVMAADVISKELISFMARAAIEAMREPTDAMVDAMDESDFESWSPEPGEGRDCTMRGVPASMPLLKEQP